MGNTPLKKSSIYVITLALCNPNCLHGSCVAPDSCICELGWTGGTCNQGMYLYKRLLWFRVKGLQCKMFISGVMYCVCEMWIRKITKQSYR